MTSPLPRSKETSSSLVPTRRLRTREARRTGARGGGRRCRGGARARLLDAGAEHQLDDPLLGAGGDVDDADGLAVAEHRGAVAERRDLEQAVRDEDDRAAGGGSGGGRRRAPARRGRPAAPPSSRRGAARPARWRARARDRGRAGWRAAGRGRVSRRSRSGTPSSRTQRRNGSTGVRGEPQIGGDVEVGDQRRLLVDRHQAGAAGVGRRADVARLATDQDAAGVGADRAGQDLHQCRFAGAVRAHQRVHLAGQHARAMRCAAPRPRRSAWRRRWRRGGAGGSWGGKSYGGVCATGVPPALPARESGSARPVGAGQALPGRDGAARRRFCERRVHRLRAYSPGPLQATIWSLV